MFKFLKKISLGNWILIGMILGFIVGLFLNFYVDDPYIKNTILIDNIFYLGGTGFIRLMKMLVVPLVFCSIIVGVSSISDIKKIGTIGGRTILIYLVTTAMAITIALLIGMVIKPGMGLNLVATGQSTSVTINQTMTDTILNVIPENPFTSLASGDMLPVIIFAVIIGIILAQLKEEVQLVSDFFDQSNKIMMEMTSLVMKFAPIGVFCLMAKTFAGLGFEGLLPMGKYVLCVLVGLAVQAVLVYPSLMVVLTRLNPIRFFKKFFSVMLFAFSASSSNATIPINIDKLEEMGVSREVSSFTIPLGATVNMDGTAIMQGVAVMFAAQAYGIDLGTSALITVIFTAVLASVGTAGVPSVGLVDMFRTAVNVAGDAVCTIIVSLKNKSMDVDVYNGKKEAEVDRIDIEDLVA